jgi:branched-chain amino acid transport system permease protein
LLATVVAALIVAAVGAVIGFLTLRLGDLYVGLVTFSFSLLIETLVFTRPVFFQDGTGIPISPPRFAQGPMVFCYLSLAVLALFALLTLNLRRSTSGLALRAVRDSEPASRTLGLSILQVKVIVGALAAFVAAVGGSFIAMSQGVAQQQNFETYIGLVWLAVAVTLGVRSIIAAAFAGLTTALIPAVFLNYLPPRWITVPTVFFGLGAIAAVRQPEGAVLHTARQIRSLLERPHDHEPPASQPDNNCIGSSYESIAVGPGVAPAAGPTRAP